MSWEKVSLPSGTRLFKIHNFCFLAKGSNYLIEIDEFATGACTGHAEHATDANFVIESVSAPTVKDCLESVIKKIEQRLK